MRFFRDSLNESMRSPHKRFIQALPRLKTCCVLWLCIAIVSGCSSFSDKPQKKRQAAVKPGQVAEKEAGALSGGTQPSFVAIPNPYKAGNIPGPARAQFKEIKKLMAQKKWKQALGPLNRMIESFPRLSGPYVNLGIAQQKLGDIEQAEKAFKFAIETNKHNFDAYTQLGVLYRVQGRFKEAEAVYKKALSHWPHHRASVKNIAILYDLYMGRFTEALSYYELGQKLAGDKDRQFKGWIADLKRRMKSK